MAAVLLRLANLSLLVLLFQRFDVGYIKTKTACLVLPKGITLATRV